MIGEKPIMFFTKPALRHLACCGLLFMTLSGQLQAQQPESSEFPFNYLALQAGVHDLGMWPARVNLGNAIGFPGEITLDPRFPLWSVQLGRQYEKYRYGVEYERGGYEVSEISLNNIVENVSSTGHYNALTLNASRLHKFSEKVEGSAGLGIGWGSAKLPALGFSTGCQCFPAAKAGGGIWQLRIGLEYQVGENSRLGLFYSRLFGLPGPDSGNALPSIQYEDRDIGRLTIGFQRRL